MQEEERRAQATTSQINKVWPLPRDVNIYIDILYRGERLRGRLRSPSTRITHQSLAVVYRGAHYFATLSLALRSIRDDAFKNKEQRVAYTHGERMKSLSPLQPCFLPSQIQMKTLSEASGNLSSSSKFNTPSFSTQQQGRDPKVCRYCSCLGRFAQLIEIPQNIDRFFQVSAGLLSLKKRDKRLRRWGRALNPMD